MDKSQDPRQKKGEKVDERRISFSDDFQATTINPHSYSPMRRLSEFPIEKEIQPENQKLRKIKSQLSTQIMTKSNIDLLPKVPSLFFGGFESIISKVSDTYKIHDILPKNSSANIIKSEYSISSSNATNLDPTLMRHPTEKTTDSRRKNSIRERKPSLVNVDPLLSSMSSGRRNSLLGKNVVTDRGTFGLIVADDDWTEIKEDTFIKSKNESEGTQKLPSFDNRATAKIIPVESDNESIKSFGSHSSDDEQPDVNISVMASFTGELLKRKSTLLGAAKALEINIIPEASVHLDSNKLGISLTGNVKRRGSFASSLFNVQAPTEEIKPPQSNKSKLRRLQQQKTQPINKQRNNNRLLALEVEHAAPVPKIKESKKKDSIKIIDSTTSGTIEKWKRLRDDSRGHQYGEAVDSEKSKFVGMSEVASVVNDLKSLEMDPYIINEVDKTALKSVIGIKKWVKSSKQRKDVENLDLRKFIKTLDHRLVNEIPKSLSNDLVIAVIPILHNLKKEYQSQLGDCHECIERLNSVIQSLNIQSDYKKKKSIVKDRETNWSWSRFMKIFQPPQGRVSPVKLTQTRVAEYDDDDNQDDYILPITNDTR